MYNTIKIEKINEFVEIIFLNRPHVLNAINIEMAKELNQVLAKIKKSKIRVLILASKCKNAFCVGADLKERMKMSLSEWEAKHKELEKLNTSFSNLNIPIIACVNGYAFGGGLELALLCDFIYASENASFALPEVKVGLMPGLGGTQRLPRKINLSKAKEMIFTGKSISAKEAYDIGLINKLEKYKVLLKKVLEVANEISKNAPLGVQGAKESIDKGFDVLLEDGLDIEIKHYKKTITSKDRIEGIIAFNEKRRPLFKGM